MISRAGSTNPNYTLDDILKITQSKPASGFRRVLGAVAGGVGNIFLPGVGGAIGNAIAGNVLGAAMPTLGSETTQYLALQRQIQQETLAFQLASTVLKVRHDSALEAIRNMK